MSRFSVTPDQLFDRPWRAGHPFRPRCSRLRRWSMVLLLLVLIFTIGGYRYLTDSNRVRVMAEGYLSHLAKGHVEVEQATLSIFEGLRLENVRVHAEDDAPHSAPATRPAITPGSGPEDDSVIFSARTLVIHYSPRMMLAGQLVAQQIVIEKPRVYLVKDLDRNTWNFARLGQQGRGIPRPIPTRPGKPLQIPEILLRNAQVEVSETRGSMRRDMGFMAIDGQISASPEGDRYLFELQSRGEEGVGPLVSGAISTQTGEVDAQLRNFEFGRESLFGHDLQSMLPDAVREWWNRHGIAGRLDIPALHYSPPRSGLPASFRIETALNGVTLMVPPQEWQSVEDIRRGSAAVDAALSLRQLYEAAGFGALAPVQVTPSAQMQEVQGSVGLTDLAAGGQGEFAAPDHASAPASAGPANASRAPAPLDATADDDRGMGFKTPAPAPVQTLASLLQGTSVTMRQVAGTLVFTPAGIDVTNLNGRIENNGVSISGHIDGYRPDAAATLRIASLKSEDIYIPPSPRYINSLPSQAREIYESIRPTGTCRFEVNVNRPQPGARILASGSMDIVDGQFTLEKFPYPMRGVTGRIVFDSDTPGGPSWLRLVGVRARGPEGGANQDHSVDVEGKIGPFETPFPEPGFDIWVLATGVNSDPQLRQSLPPEVEQALQVFKDPDDPQSPHFHGDFWCHVFRAPGPGKKWTFDTDIKLDRTTGRVAAFPYPLAGVGANVFVREGHVRIESGHAQNGPVSLNFDGCVVWDRKAAAQSMREESSQIGSFAPEAAPPARFNILSANEGLARIFTTESSGQLKTRIGLHARRLPVDAVLLSAIPADRRKWLEKLQVDGTVDVDGDLAAPDAPIAATPIAAASRAATPAPAISASGIGAGATAAGGNVASSNISTRPAADSTRPVLAAAPMDMSLVYDLAISIHDARVTPAGSKLTMSGVGGTLHLGTDLLRIDELHGTRGKGVLGINGLVDWKGPIPRLALQGKAMELTLDRPLYQVLPASVQRAWDALHPDGSIDADISFNGFADGSDAPPPQGEPHPPGPGTGLSAVADAHLLSAPRSPANQTAIEPTLTLPAGLHALLRPRHLMLTPEAMPYRFDNVQGVITLARSHVVLDNLKAAHGDGVFNLSGVGDIEDTATWELRLSGENVKVDDALRQALPGVLRSLVDSLKLRGVTDFRFPRLVYRIPPTAVAGGADGGPSHPASQTAPATPDPQVDLTATIALKNGSMDVGVPLENVNGQLQLDAEVRDGHLASARGHVDVSQLSMAGRTLRNFHSDLTRVADRDELQLDKMSAELAGGSMAGRLNLIFPDDGPSRYNLDLVLRNADVRELTGAADPDISGDLTASLSLEGAWGDGASQRGRGDVTVAGKDMYHIPLVLGLLQVTNLALPIAEPFNRGSIRYSLDGKRVNFEKIDMRSDSMVMSGTGHLDFATRQVRMSFVTDNPGGLRVPFLRDLWQGARNELLKINVKGTIQEPKVETSVMGTFSTTIDEVFRGDAEKR